MTPDLSTRAATLTARLAYATAARVLPWANRSQHTAYLSGYVEGIRDGWERGYRAGLADGAGT